MTLYTFFHSNEPLVEAHFPLRTREFLENSGLKTLPHPPYSPDLAPCDFWLFSRIKDELRGKRFSTNEELVGGAFRGD